LYGRGRVSFRAVFWVFMSFWSVSDRTPFFLSAIEKFQGKGNNKSVAKFKIKKRLLRFGEGVKYRGSYGERVCRALLILWKKYPLGRR